MRSLIVFTVFFFLRVPVWWLQGKKGKTTAGGSDEKDAGGGEDEKPAYVHVRARRGQATDSHSLAERVSFAA